MAVKSERDFRMSMASSNRHHPHSVYVYAGVFFMFTFIFIFLFVLITPCNIALFYATLTLVLRSFYAERKLN